MYNIGVIGCGVRMDPLVKRLVEEKDFQLKAVCDVNPEYAKSHIDNCEGVEFYTDADKMLETEKLDCIMIGTRCSLHTPLMLKVAQYGIPAFLEKPVSVTEEQVEALKSALIMDDKVVVSFPLRNTPIANNVRDIIKSGALGKLSQVQAYNNVHYGRVYYHDWYRDESETGGLWLQKATHDFDYINSLLGDLKPVQICAMESKLIFKGDEPNGMACEDCPKRAECKESDINVEKIGDTMHYNKIYCCFAKDTGNMDSGTAIIKYDNGLHAVYTQNFVVRKEAGGRGARIVGELATLDFDFRKRVITVCHHYERRIERHELGLAPGHSGGDEALITNFANVVRGKEKSKSPLRDGILSAKMCLAAKKSATESVFVNIK